MTASMDRLLSHHHILLLQGKMGRFFARFSRFLQDQGKTVSKVNFNAGDKFFYGKASVAYDYQGQIADFEAWLRALIVQNGMDAVVCFGDCRPYHAAAARVCKRLGCAFFVFEEGYLRPDYITFEEDGINGNSQLDIRKIQHLPKAADKPINTHNRFFKLCFAAIIYYFMVGLGKKQFPYYEHYRGLGAVEEGLLWVKAFYRKMMGYIPDKRLQSFLLNKLDHRYFVVSLQVHNDTQITHHSDYADVKDFIQEVLISFAHHANANHALVFKHHPLDRGHRNYKDLINQLAEDQGIADRVFYGCDMHLPTLIKHSLGMITVNSTTGLQSIYHKKPTKVMGRALYDVALLTDQKPLDQFWQNPQAPDASFYGKFREYLIEQTQLNGSFYGNSPWMKDYYLKDMD